MKEKVKRIVLMFFCFLNILSLSGCYNRDIVRMHSSGFYIKWEVPKIINKKGITKFKLYYGHDYDSSHAEIGYLDIIFEFKLSIITWDTDSNEVNTTVIFAKNLTSDYIKDQSNRVDKSGSWIWSKVTLKKYYEVELTFSDYNYEAGRLEYEFSYDDIKGAEPDGPHIEIITYFKANESIVYFYYW